MSEKIVLDLPRFEAYAKQSQRECADIQTRQAQMATAFMRLGENWEDAVYTATGNVLREVDKKLRATYDGLRRSIYAMVDYHNGMCDYNDCANLRLNCRIAEYSSNIRDGIMSKQTIQTDPEMLKTFSQKLTQYVQETEYSFKQIKGRHVEMRHYWKSPQYHQFAAVIDSVEIDLRRQLDLLRKGSELIMRKYQVIKENQGVNINKKS